ncbi:mannose-6-phosphate isomerase [Chloroflexales bacterium ZM16-3]|nr:mannose-6-phosphate isomerase [Chloroflexales bacterium ZM16-3]
MNTPLYPLLTERKIVEPIWGGGKLAAWLDLPEPHPVHLGETWQVYDTNLVTNGPLAGYSLAEIAHRCGTDLVGTRSFARYGADFPLLAKFIAAADRLSIQVHPDDAYAHTREAASGFHGKAEAWYILDAAPEANVVYGLSRHSDRDSFAAAVRDGELEDLLQRIPVAADNVIFVPAGTIHAINAGIMLFEIQQKSDLTYRVFDYDRRDAQTGLPRELHLAKALEVSDFGPAHHAKPPALELAPNRDLLVACPYFALERLRVSGEVALGGQDSFEILILIDGEGSLTWSGGTIPLRLGDTPVLPASLTGCVLSGDTTVLRTYVPDLGALAADLRDAGYTDAQIGATLHP